MEYYKHLEEEREVSSPRDLQMRQRKDLENESIISELKKQIEDLKLELRNKPTQVGYTDDEFNEVLVEEVKKAVDSVSVSYEAEVAKLTALLEAKQEIIDTLKMSISTGTVQAAPVNSDRPEIDDNIFINPMDDSDGKGLTSHITVKESKDDDNINSQVSKLKNILGKK